ncbi:hypothetical protein ACH5RR_027576 [Cinchona calisaya]|uniref:Uncharacterized protein n=1 Tax=Cinchona calisaya TaxID=153742 RepID=A0ABD2Z5V3_9GENT
MPTKSLYKISIKSLNPSQCRQRSSSSSAPKTLRDQKRAELLKGKRATSGTGSPPRVIVLFGLSYSVDLNLLKEDLLGLLSPKRNGIEFPAVASSEYKLRATILKAPYGDLSACMEMAKCLELLVYQAVLY